MTEAEMPPKRRTTRKEFLIAGAILVALVGVPATCAGLTAQDNSCARQAGDLYGSEYRRVEVTFRKDEFVKGVVRERSTGDVVRHWDCEDGTITWSSTTD